MCLFAYQYEYNSVSIFVSIQNRSLKRGIKVITRVTLTSFLIYIFIGYSAYFSTLNDTPELFILRSNSDGSPNKAMLTIALIFLVVLAIHFPMFIFPYRQAVSLMIFNREVIPFYYNFAVVLFGCLLVYFFSTYFTSLLNLLGLLGSMCMLVFIPVPAFAIIRHRVTVDGMVTFKTISFALVCSLVTLVCIVASIAS